MSSRAHARRRLTAWDRYARRYQDPGATTGRGSPGLRWYLRARRHRPVGRRR